MRKSTYLGLTPFGLLSYNADGQLDMVTDALGNTMTNTYDLRNLLATTTDPLGFKTHNTYDAAMRLVGVKNALGHSGTTAFDAVGNVVSIKSALGHTNYTEYNDARYLPTKATDALGYDITFSYDEDGRQISMTNRRDNIYTTSYDDANRKVMTATPEGRETTVFANARGLPETTIRPSDKIVKNTSFDAEGRVLTQVIYSDTSQTTILASSTMSYDAAGRLYQVKENGKTTTHTYDSLGRLASYSDGEGNTMSYGYDAANNLTTLTYPGNLTVTYTYDANNRLESVTDWRQNGGTITYTYDAAGRLRKTERPNGTKRNQVYDAVEQLRFIEERSATDVLMWMRALGYDKDGRITSTHTWPSNTSTDYTALNASDSASYDNDNRIAQWNLGSGGSVNAVFDADGNMTHGPAVNNPNSTGLGYQYDAHNRLTGVGGQANLYRYNPEGHRVEASGIQYVIDPNAALSRTLMRVDGSTTTYYIWGANGIEYEITGGTTKTYHADHLGSTMLLTNDSGQPTGDYYEYDSYGTPTHRTGTANTPFQWHGTLGVTTENNGLLHMRARFYHPRIMRFVNEDPIGFQGGLNLFAFVDGDPMSGVDPAGLCRYDWNSNTIAPTSLIPTNTLSLNSTLNVRFRDDGGIEGGGPLLASKDIVPGALARSPSFGNARIKSAGIGVSSIRQGDPGTFDAKKAAILDFAGALSHPLSPMSWTSGVPNVVSPQLLERIEGFIQAGLTATSQGLGVSGVTGIIMNNLDKVTNASGPYQAWTIIQSEVYTEHSYLFGLWTTRSWNAQPSIITPVNNGDLVGGYHISSEGAARAAAEVLARQLNSGR
jgi:RHS repeat-associated protein